MHTPHGLPGFFMPPTTRFDQWNQQVSVFSNTAVALLLPIVLAASSKQSRLVLSTYGFLISHFPPKRIENSSEANLCNCGWACFVIIQAGEGGIAEAST